MVFRCLGIFRTIILAASLASAATVPGPVPVPPGIGSRSFLPSFPTIPGPSPWVRPGTFAIPGIRHYQRIEIDPVLLLRQAQSLRQGILRLDLGAGFRWDLELERVSVRAEGYRLRLATPQGLRDIAPGPELLFRGRIQGNPASRVRLSLADGRVTGFIDPGAGEKTFLEPLDILEPGESRAAHAVYHQSDLVLPAGAACGWRPAGDAAAAKIAALPAPTVPSTSVAAAEPCALVEIGVAAEYSMVKGYGSNAAVEKRIMDIFNMVEGLYEDPRINIHIKITEMIIEAGPDQTWGPMNISGYLGNLTPWARGPQGFKNSYDVADLWYYDPLVTTGTTGLANVGTVCNKTSGGHVIRDFTRTASFLMINQAHELGHNFGANHVNNPKAILNPMILGDNVAWDDTTIAAILKHKHSRVCLSSCNLGPTAGFLVKAQSACSDRISFTDASRGEPTAWKWNFGDGQTSTERNPAHTYAKEGTYTASLTSSNAAGSDTAFLGNIKVKPYAAPLATGASRCTPGTFSLKASGAGTLKWYDGPEAGEKIAEGSTFETPSLGRTTTYYVEAGDPDFPVRKVGPVSNAIGGGNYFTANSERRLYFDVARPALLKSARVYANGAGPRTIEILDQGDVRVASRTVQVPAGESRITLDFELAPGHDYVIKYAGNPDSLDLFRNNAGAIFPYRSADSLIAITHSDATVSDSAVQSGYYYYFYDWEVRELGCASIRVPVRAEISCVPIASQVPSVRTSLMAFGSGRYRIAGFGVTRRTLEYRLRGLDGRIVRSHSETVPAGAFAADFDLAGLPANLYLLEVRLDGSRMLENLIGF